MATTFQVNDVVRVRDDIEDAYYGKRIPYAEKLTYQYTHKPRPGSGPGAMAVVEAAVDLEVLAYGSSSALVAAVGQAYNRHLPLSLSPDHIWLAIAHGFAHHVKTNAEELRKQFVDFEGKKYLHVHADDFVLRSKHNDWPRVFEDFSGQIEKFIGKKRALLTCDFTTTTIIERAASDIVLMDAMSKYFDYGMSTACGFPSITLEGEVSDWESILVRVGNLREFGNIGWWIDPLEMVCAKLVETAQGKPDLGFWGALYDEYNMSGGPFISGWINVFYPFVKAGKDLARNRYIEEESFRKSLAHLVSRPADGRRGRGGAHGPKPSDYPSLISTVPVEWNYHGKELEMRFTGGLGAVAPTPDGGVRPAATWGILDVTGLSATALAKLEL